MLFLGDWPVVNSILGCLLFFQRVYNHVVFYDVGWFQTEQDASLVEDYTDKFELDLDRGPVRHADNTLSCSRR